MSEARPLSCVRLQNSQCFRTRSDLGCEQSRIVRLLRLELWCEERSKVMQGSQIVRGFVLGKHLGIEDFVTNKH